MRRWVNEKPHEHVHAFTHVRISDPQGGQSVVDDLFYSCRGSSTNRPCFFKTKPISKKAVMAVSSYNEKVYEDLGVCRLGKSKAKQTQFEPMPMSRWVSFCGLSELRPAMCSTGRVHCTWPPNETLAAGGFLCGLIDDVKICNRALCEERVGELAARSVSWWLANGIVRW